MSPVNVFFLGLYLVFLLVFELKTSNADDESVERNLMKGGCWGVVETRWWGSDLGTWSLPGLGHHPFQR